MILSRGDLKSCDALCTMCNVEPPIMVFYHVAEQGKDLLLCFKCASSLEIKLRKDSFEYLSRSIIEYSEAIVSLRETITEQDMRLDRRARKGDLDAEI